MINTNRLKELCHLEVREIEFLNEIKKLKSKLKIMEITFEQINNSRNDLIKQLCEQELLNQKLQQTITSLKEEINNGI